MGLQNCSLPGALITHTRPLRVTSADSRRCRSSMAEDQIENLPVTEEENVRIFSVFSYNPRLN